MDTLNKRALITGITGQDGAYLASFLLKKGYKVFGTFRRSSSLNFWRLDELGIRHHDQLSLLENDITDLSSNIHLIESIEPDEIYNLAAQSFVGVSFNQPILTAQTTGMGTLNVLEAIRVVNTNIKFYQASSSEMFGLVQEVPQSENTVFYPRSPYGCAKVFAHNITINYRESFGLFSCCGILFNHESPLRGLDFVTRKISHCLAEIKLGKRDFFELGNLDAKRDWGFAGDYVDGMWRMMQTNNPDVFVLATSRTETVRRFVELCCKVLDIDLVWKGEFVNEVGIDTSTGKEIIKINHEYYRPSEVDLLLGDYSKAKKMLGWEPKVDLEHLSSLMVNADLKRIKEGLIF